MNMEVPFSHYSEGPCIDISENLSDPLLKTTSGHRSHLVAVSSVHEIVH